MFLKFYEQEPDTLKDYLDSLLLELIGSKELIFIIRNDANFISLLSTLQYFIDNECTHDVFRREVFKCIDIIKKIQRKYNLE